MRFQKLPVPAAIAFALIGLSAATARENVRQVPGTSGPVATSPRPALLPTPSVETPAVDKPSVTANSSPALPAPAAGERGALTVTVNRAKVIRLPERALTVIVGNPAIADLSLQKNGIVVVTGKSYGTTNLIALDGTGTMLAESLVNVVAPNDGLVVVQRAFDRFSYSCNPVCQPSINLGDSNAYFNDAKGQADAHNQFAVSK
jgi:Flp pilus assembly secretin CpaC